MFKRIIEVKGYKGKIDTQINNMISLKRSNIKKYEINQKLLVL